MRDRRTPLVLAALTILGGGCAQDQPDSPPPEATPEEGVFGRAPQAVGGIPSVVTLRAQGPVDEGSGDEAPLLDQFGLAFSPRELIARVGQPVTIANSESLPHNVHIRSVDGDSTVLNVDTDPGQRFEFVFEEPGGYDVLCDVHPGMRAFVFATTALRARFADQEGNFAFEDVPPGTYTISVWGVDPAQRSDQQIEVGAGSTEVSFHVAH